MKTVNYAMEIIEFQETTELSLEQLRENIEGFVCPQMYYYGGSLRDSIIREIKEETGPTIHKPTTMRF